MPAMSNVLFYYYLLLLLLLLLLLSIFLLIFFHYYYFFIISLKHFIIIFIFSFYFLSSCLLSNRAMPYIEMNITFLLHKFLAENVNWNSLNLLVLAGMNKLMMDGELVKKVTNKR